MELKLILGAGVLLLLAAIVMIVVSIIFVTIVVVSILGSISKNSNSMRRLLKVTGTDKKTKGEYGESLAYKLLGEPHIKGERRILRNLYIPYRNNYSEIDIVMITSKKILVVECKEYQGAIRGKADDKYWAQTINNNRRYDFYSPLKQNRTHIHALAKQLNMPYSQFVSIIVFGNEATLVKVPPNTESCFVINRRHLSWACNWLYDKGVDVFSSEDIANISGYLQQFANADESIKKAHLDKVRQYQSA
jgi:Holliday junction resolvase-like predicted endonuclease